MNAATFSLVFLIILGVTAMLCEGRIGGATERCLCRETNLQKRVKSAVVKGYEVFLPSVSCSYTEILISTKRGRKFCLDPKGWQGRQILSGQKQKKKSKKQRGKPQKKNKYQD